MRTVCINSTPNTIDKLLIGSLCRNRDWQPIQNHNYSQSTASASFNLEVNLFSYAIHKNDWFKGKAQKLVCLFQVGMNSKVSVQLVQYLRYFICSSFGLYDSNSVTQVG